MIKFGCRISRLISTRPHSGIVEGFRENGKPLDRELVIYPYEHLEWNKIEETVKYIEHLGYDSIIVPDHLMTGVEKFESWTILSALGSITKKIRLGALVLCYAYRGLPSIFAKQVVTLDHITNGRLDLGLGAGYEKQEFNAYGVGWRPAKQRISELDEFLNVLKLMWTEDVINYKGKYFEVNNAICEPKTIQKPYPPIIIGGNKRLILKVAAKHADCVNISTNNINDIVKTLKILDEHCESIGRDPKKIEKSWGEWVALFENEKELMKNEDIIKKSPNTWCGTPEQAQC